MTPYYEADGITLFHGDCLEVEEWLTGDVLVTDPPYGVAWAAGRLHSERQERQSSTQSISNDEDTLCRDTALALWGEDRPAVVFGTWRQPIEAMPNHRLIWHKQGRHPGVSPHPWYSNDEEIWLVGTGWQGPPHPTVITTAEQRAREPQRIGHPTPKPLPLMETLIQKSPPGTVVDPFAGSGSTLLAARNQGRTAIGVEIEEAYCELIASRLAQGVLV